MPRTAELVLDARSQTGESPVWDIATQSLWWTDIPARRVHHFTPATGAHVSYVTPGRVGCLVLRAQGGLMVGMEHGLGVFDPSAGTFVLIDEPEAGLDGNRFNDGRADRHGRFFAGSMFEPRGKETGVLWRLQGRGPAHAVASGVVIANGLAWSPDDRTLYWADTPSGRIWTFDYNIETGVLGTRRLWIETRHDVPGLPDGAAVDAEGCYWSARYFGGAIARFRPDGRLDRIISVPTPRVTMCAFGGPQLRTLYITTAWNGMSDSERAADPQAGGLFAIDPGVAGLPEPAFAG